MAVPLSRRKVLGAAALAPIVLDGITTAAAGAAPSASPAIRTGALYVLVDPVRVFDSRTNTATGNAGRLLTGNAVGVSFGAAVDEVSGGAHSPAAVWINITITETQGVGYLVARPSDATGEKPLPPTSNVNWSTNGQTLANLAFVAIGYETYIELHAGGTGSTHVIVDLQGYLPITT